MRSCVILWRALLRAAGVRSEKRADASEGVPFAIDVCGKTHRYAMTGFPIHDATPVTWPGPPPEDADVVVIGGGVVGVCTALYLAEGGQRVVLLGKGTHCRGTVQPQLGMDSSAGARPG